MAFGHTGPPKEGGDRLDAGFERSLFIPKRAQPSVMPFGCGFRPFSFVSLVPW
jgi:hypothetical protein